MKIAIATDNDKVSAHFGRCPQFTVLEIKSNKLINKEVIDNPGHRAGFLPEYFHDKGIGCIVAGGAGRRASSIFKDKGIDLIVGITGSINEVIDKALKGTLESGETLYKPGEGRGYGIERHKTDKS